MRNWDSGTGTGDTNVGKEFFLQWYVIIVVTNMVESFRWKH